MNIIWQTLSGEQTDFEFEYLTKIIFSNESDKIFDNNSFSTIIDNSVIVYSNNQKDPPNELINYLNKFIEKKYNFYLVHLSNEDLGHNFQYYKSAKKVFRNYYDPNINLKNVIFIPLGFKSGFYNSDFKVETLNKIKNYSFCFIGQPKADRLELLHTIKDKNSFIHATGSWNCSTSLSQNDCKEIYRKTKFAPCPMGFSNPDSFRIMEALEWGCIPIIKKYNNFDYHTKIWGYNMIPKVNSWQELEIFYNLSDKSYEDLFNKIFSWYKDFRKKINVNLNEE